jgi:hypothetical protein
MRVLFFFIIQNLYNSEELKTGLEGLDKFFEFFLCCYNTLKI